MAYIETDNSPINLGTGAYGNGSGIFNNDAIWAIILFAMIFGWGNGYGFGGNGGGAVDGYVLTSDFANIERKIDAVNNGVCDGFYAMNTGMLNGFAGINNAITTNGYETRDAIQGLSSQFASCCCDLKGGIKDTQYAIAMQTNALSEVMNANYRALHDEIVANRIEDKNAQIAAQQNEINKLQLAASQSAQNAYLVNTLRPTAIPAYLTCSPYQSVYGCGTTACGSVV